MKKILFSLFIALSVLLTVQVASANSMFQGEVTVPSAYPFSKTVKRLADELKQRQFIIRGMIDHQHIAKLLGHDIPPNVALLFGKPEFEYPLIKANPRAALFVPLTLAVWQDDQGKVFVSYWDPATDMLPLLHFTNQQAIRDVNSMSTTLKMLVKQATAEPQKKAA